MKVFNKEYITAQTHKVMLHQEKNILVGDILQTEWDYFICLPFQPYLWGKSKKEYELILRGVRHRLLSKLTTKSERNSGAVLETFPVLHRVDRNAHFHFAIKVPNEWKKIKKSHNKFNFVKDKVGQVIVRDMKLVAKHLWDEQDKPNQTNKIFLPIQDNEGMFSYCVADTGILADLIDKTNMKITRKVG
jgi:hypothetical protein